MKEKRISEANSPTNKELFTEYSRNKTLELRNEIVQRYIYIVDIIVRKYLNKGIEYDDLYQIGSLALIYAVERFDADKGFEFTSFATPTIIGEIKKYFRDKGWAIKTPRRLQELLKKTYEAKTVLSHKFLRNPTIPEIAEYLQCTEEEILEAMEAGNIYDMQSFNQPIENGDKEGSFLEDLLGQEDIRYLKLENMDFLKNASKKLSKEEFEILRLRYGENKSQKEIAGIMGVSQMTISRMENKIISKFRDELNKNY